MVQPKEEPLSSLCVWMRRAVVFDESRLYATWALGPIVLPGHCLALMEDTLSCQTPLCVRRDCLIADHQSGWSWLIYSVISSVRRDFLCYSHDLRSPHVMIQLKHFHPRYHFRSGPKAPPGPYQFLIEWNSRRKYLCKLFHNYIVMPNNMLWGILSRSLMVCEEL